MTERQFFEIKQADPKGLGAYATSSIKPGTLLLAEPPLLRVNTDYYFKSDIEALFAALPTSKQEIYFSLSSAHGQPLDWYPSKIHPAVSEEERKRIKEQHAARTGKEKSVLSVFMTNAMDTGEGAAVFERASRFNHCCVPNACFAWNEKLGVETIYAIKDIKLGEVSQALRSLLDCDPSMSSSLDSCCDAHSSRLMERMFHRLLWSSSSLRMLMHDPCRRRLYSRNLTVIGNHDQLLRPFLRLHIPQIRAPYLRLRMRLCCVWRCNGSSIFRC